MQKQKLGFNVILLGQIASGKDTQAQILMDKYTLKPVESGVFSRKLLKAKTPDGDWARRTTGKGLPLPTPLLQKFLISQIEKKPKGKDLIFIGNPRLKPEAQLLKKLLNAKNQEFMAFYVTLPDKEVYRRSLGRKESNVKAVFKVLDEKHLVAKRIAWHKDQVSKSVGYFASLGKMKKVSGMQSIEKVSADIEKTLQSFKKKITPQK